MSGISSVIGVILALENRLISPTIGVKCVNPKLQLDERNMSIVSERTLWPESAVRRASVNSFGYGGANAHAILEAADTHAPGNVPISTPRGSAVKKAFILTLSAQSRSTLTKLVEDLASYDCGADCLEDLAYTLSLRRMKLAVRGFLLANSDTISSDININKLRLLEAKAESLRLPLAFIFTGQGAQWATMGSSLFKRFPTFRRAIQELDGCLACLCDTPCRTIEGKRAQCLYPASS